MNPNSLSLISSRNLGGHRNQYESSSDHEEEQVYMHFYVPSPSFHHLPEEGGTYAPWRQFEERVRTGPYGLSSFPNQPYSPIRILIVSSGTHQERMNPRLRHFITNSSPPRIRNQWQAGPTEHNSRGLTDHDFNKAMQKLRKETYNYTPPTTNTTTTNKNTDNYNNNSRKKSGLRGIFSSKTSNIAGHNNKAAAEDEAKKNNNYEGSNSCTICLEVFVTHDRVLVAPCNHMFHNDCLVPWVKSHGKCPVCRFELCEKREINGYSNTNNNGGVDDLNTDVISLIRAMEEAFSWVHVTRY